MQKSFNSRKYFIDAFKHYVKNTNKSLSKIYTPSIRELLLDYIEIHEDIISSLELEKLGNARNDLIEAMEFYIKNSILYNSKLYKIELSLLIEQTKKVNNKGENEKTLHFSHIYTICNSLIKKIDSRNIYLDIIDMVINYTSYGEAEKAAHLMLNELIYEGYSLKYLDQWVSENLNYNDLTINNVDIYLKKFAGLKRQRMKYTYYINILRNEHLEKEQIYIDFNLSLIKQNFDNLSFGLLNDEDSIKNFLQKNKDYDIYKIEIESLDRLKGIQQVLGAINSYFQMVSYVSMSKNKREKSELVLDKIIAKDSNGKIWKMRIVDSTPVDTRILFSTIENRERQDVEDFILYREKVFLESAKSQEVFNIQRALNIVKNQLPQSQENKIINLWSVLEYILTFKESGGSIISKVKDIVPKIICLYILKDKLNNLWSMVYENKQKSEEIEIIEGFMKCKRNNEEYQYDLNSLIKFILEQSPESIKKMNFDTNLVRGILEIGQFLTNPKTLHDYLENKKEEIKHDLVRSYRARNVLIHSGKETHVNLDLKALRLYMYNNNLLGLLIYYLYKNPQYKISEVLNSIDYTYDNYMSGLKENTMSHEEICKPKYIFIG